jgi:hypothetical protein
MSVVRRNYWRLAFVAIGLCASDILLSSSSSASAFHVDNAAPLLAQGADPTLKEINSDPFSNPTSNHKTQVEPGSYSFGSTIVTAMQSGRFFDGGASDISFSTSTDSGQSWSTKGTLPGTTVYSTPPGSYARTSDPSVAYDAKHNVWLISYLGIKSPTNADVDVSRSTDGGKTFGAPVIVRSQGTDLLDKNWTTCDNTPTSPFFGHCYTEFDDNTELNLVQISTSTDGGVTWGAPMTTPDQACVIGGQPVVQPNGTVVMPIADCFETSVLSIRSTDGGVTWSLPTFVGQEIFFGAAGNLRAGDLPSANIDASGRVYVTWTDCRSEARCTAGVDDVLISSSSDGITWTNPSRIPIAKVGSTVEPMILGLGIDHNAKGPAHLGLVYYFYPNQVIGNNFCATETCQLEVGFISSANGGDTWSTPQTLAGPMNLTWLPLTTQGFMVGDYIATSIVSGGGATPAFPMFMVATAPSAKTCSTVSNGNNNGRPGEDCNEPTFTVANGASVSGGSVPATPALSSPSTAGNGPFHFDIPEDDAHAHKAHTVN